MATIATFPRLFGETINAGSVIMKQKTGERLTVAAFGFAGLFFVQNAIEIVDAVGGYSKNERAKDMEIAVHAGLGDRGAICQTIEKVAGTDSERKILRMTLHHQVPPFRLDCSR